jgi:predicted flap endonuclease-1-like 5' DNA nuclease
MDDTDATPVPPPPERGGQKQDDNLRQKQDDNLRLIRGVGHAVEARLHDADVRTFADLAARSPEELAAIVAGLPRMSPKEVSRWRDQARELAAEASTSAEGGQEGNHQRYQTFTVELLLEEEAVRRTRARHVQTGDTRQWKGFPTDELLAFFTTHVGLEQAAMVGPSPPTGGPAELGGGLATSASLRMRGLDALPAGSEDPTSMLAAGTPFTVRLILDLEAASGRLGPMDYLATVRAKRLGGGSDQVIDEQHGTLTGTGPASIAVRGGALPAGTYRLEAAIRLLDAETGRPAALSGLVEGNLLHVYDP